MKRARRGAFPRPRRSSELAERSASSSGSGGPRRSRGAARASWAGARARQCSIDEALRIRRVERGNLQLCSKHPRSANLVQPASRTVALPATLQGALLQRLASSEMRLNRAKQVEFRWRSSSGQYHTPRETKLAVRYKLKFGPAGVAAVCILAIMPCMYPCNCKRVVVRSIRAPRASPTQRHRSLRPERPCLSDHTQ